MRAKGWGGGKLPVDNQSFLFRSRWLMLLLEGAIMKHMFPPVFLPK